ncbi:hypothetical protein BGZ65_006849, partial [Modicella reniformis]
MATTSGNTTPSGLRAVPEPGPQYIDDRVGPPRSISAPGRDEITEADSITELARVVARTDEATFNEKVPSSANKLSTIAQGDSTLKNSKPEINNSSSDLDQGAVARQDKEDHTTWAERMHGHRPDRHLFPYRSAKENMHAVRTFLRRFFLIFLIIPAWVIPNILTAKAKHEQELLHGGGNSNETASHAALEIAGLKYVTLASGEAGGGGHGPELSKGANWAIFLLNMFVMMHLGKAANAALEELVPKFGMAVISLIDAMTSSTVELAVAAFALRSGLIVVVQAAMLGAILNNLLLMMGIAIVVGGIVNHQQTLKKETTQTSINILMITSIAYVIPIGLEMTLTDVYKSVRPKVTDPLLLSAQNQEIRHLVDADILKLSKFMAIILLLLYFACLAYQYRHREFMIIPETKHEGQYTIDKRHIHFWFAGFAYVVLMGAQIYSAYLLVHAVEGLGRLHHLNDSFVGFILLPIVLVADLQEEVIAIRESRANRLDRTLTLMIGSCMQIALLVTPLLVILGWIMDAGTDHQ